MMVNYDLISPVLPHLLLARSEKQSQDCHGGHRELLRDVFGAQQFVPNDFVEDDFTAIQSGITVASEWPISISMARGPFLQQAPAGLRNLQRHTITRRLLPRRRVRKSKRNHISSPMIRITILSMQFSVRRRTN